MLMGMIYHHNNGDDPFYFKLGSDGIPDTCSMVDAVTLEPLASRMTDNGKIRVHHGLGMKAHTSLWNDWGKGERWKS